MMHPKHISTYILAAATSMLSLFAVLPCQAQSKKKIIEQQPDTIPFFRGMAVGVDLIGNVIDGAKDKAGIFLIGRIMLLTYDNDGTNDKYQQKWNLPDKFLFFHSLHIMKSLNL